MSDQDRSSLYNINTIFSRQVMRKKKLIKGFLVHPIPNSPHKHHKNYVAEDNENLLTRSWELKG